MIPRAANKLSGGYQQAINQLCNLNVTYVDSSLSIFFGGLSVYCFVLSRRLKNFFGDDFDGYTDDDLRIFLEYVRFCMSRGAEPNEAALRYYGAALREIFSQLKTRTDLTEAYGVKLL